MSLHKIQNVEDWVIGWLSPKGEFISMNGESSHEGVAYLIIEEYWNLDNIGVADMLHKRGYSRRYAYEFLEEEGWIRLHGYSESKFIITKSLTFQQKQKIKSWCKVHNRTWDSAIREIK